jgi:uncharacterized protein
LKKGRGALNKETIIQNTVAFFKNELEGEGSGHDWWHIYRVTQLAQEIGRKENADLFVCTLAALLHDIADEKLNESEEIGLNKVRDYLHSQALEDEIIQVVMEIISTISFKGGHGSKLDRLEAKVVQDADRLDAIGAIGIARCFLYAGSKGHILYDPHIPPREHMTKEEYRAKEGTAINHFYEKLLKLKDLMNTKTAYQMAEGRHQFMTQYLEQFYQEWEGKL